jgi:hypothetical protein
MYQRCTSEDSDEGGPRRLQIRARTGAKLLKSRPLPLFFQKNDISISKVLKINYFCKNRGCSQSRAIVFIEF